MGTITLDSLAQVRLHDASLVLATRQKVRNHRNVESLDGQREGVCLVVTILGLEVRSISICVLADLHASLEDTVRGDLGQRAALIVYHKATNEVAGAEALVRVDALDVDDLRDRALR